MAIVAKGKTERSVKPRIVTEQMLIDASRHLWYEHEMLKYCGSYLITKQWSGLDFALYMEGFLIHARNLNYFFYGVDIVQESRLNRKWIREDDVIAEDFLESTTSWPKPVENKLSRDTVEKINKQLAHISYSRVITDRDTWDFKDMLSRLTRTFESFIRTVPRTLLHRDVIAAFFSEST